MQFIGFNIFTDVCDPHRSQCQSIFSTSGRKPSAVPPRAPPRPAPPHPAAPRPALGNHSYRSVYCGHYTSVCGPLGLDPFTWHNVSEAGHVVACVRTSFLFTTERRCPRVRAGRVRFIHSPIWVVATLGYCEQHRHANVPGRGFCVDMCFHFSAGI